MQLSRGVNASFARVRTTQQASIRYCETRRSIPAAAFENRIRFGDCVNDCGQFADGRGCELLPLPQIRERNKLLGEQSLRTDELRVTAFLQRLRQTAHMVVVPVRRNHASDRHPYIDSEAFPIR